MKLNMMVTASGSAIAQGIIKSLKLSNLNFDMITTDTQPYAVGLYRGKAGYIVPMAREPNFIDEIIKVCNKENIDCIFIGTDYELLKFAENKKRIEKETNARVVVSSPEIIKIADDKWLTHKFLIENKLPHIPSVLSDDADDLVGKEGFPLIIKPRIGDSSKDTYVIKDRRELHEKLSFLWNKKLDNKYLAKKSEPIIQKYLTDEQKEYTSTTLTFDKKCYGVLSMNREMRFGGHTTKAIIKDYPEINKQVRKVAEILNAFGPANFQSRDFNNKSLVFEINCRFSGTTPFCAELGFNTVEAAVRHIVLKEKISELNYKKGVILRYFNEVFIPHSEIEQVKKYNFIKNPKSEINKIF